METVLSSFPKIRLKSDQAFRCNYQFVGNTNKEKKTIKAPNKDEIIKRQTGENFAGPTTHFLLTNKS